MLRFDFAQLDSTSRRASSLAKLNPGRPLVVSARAQTAGRGRTGRTWCSPAGGAWFTLAWPTELPAEAAGAAPLVAGLAVRDVVAELVGGGLAERLKLKWPNDLLLCERKLAGILCEQTLGPGRRTLLVGIGINANLAPAELGTDLRRPATSLQAALGRRVDVRELIEAAGEAVAARLSALERGGFGERDVSVLRRHLAWLGERVLVRFGERQVEGVLGGLDPRGRVVLETDNGPVAFDAGEVEGLRACGRRECA
ncbi:MAG: biotin--[acetyl-CoA-carboxylase] ligase [Phycisphaeraceae bacterium]